MIHGGRCHSFVGSIGSDTKSVLHTGDDEGQERFSTERSVLHAQNARSNSAKFGIQPSLGCGPECTVAPDLDDKPVYRPQRTSTAPTIDVEASKGEKAITRAVLNTDSDSLGE